MAIISETVGSVLVHLPDDIAAPKTRKAIAHAIAAKKARVKAFAERDAAGDLRWRIEEQIAREHGELLDQDPEAELPDGGALVTEAQAILDARQRELDARTEAERRAAIKIREAATGELSLISRNALVDGDTALAMLSLVIQDAAAARDALWSSIGVGRMAQRLTADPGAPIAIQHKAYGYTFDLEAALEGLNESLKKASEELAELRDATKPATVKKPRAPRKAASEAQSPAETASEPVAEASPVTADALGEMTIEADDDA